MLNSSIQEEGNIVELNDSKTITEILNMSFITVAQQFNFTTENASEFPAFIKWHDIEKQLSNGCKLYGYSYNNQIVACVGYSHCKEQIYLVERLAVLPEYRHLGIGKNLMKFIEDKICENGGNVAEIHVVDKNLILRDWYKKLGYLEARMDIINRLPFNSCVMRKMIL